MGLTSSFAAAPGGHSWEGSSAGQRHEPIDDRPILYSIGGDRDDDDGVSPEDPVSAQPRQFGVSESISEGDCGDWVLWPPQHDRRDLADPLSEEPAESEL
jgi:hypothetical protein